MTKKDYELIAGVISKARAEALVSNFDTATLLYVTGKLMDAFEADNPRFKRHTFGVACLPDETGILVR